MIRRIAPALVLLLLLPMQARALNTQDILSLVSMPLAVAAVSDLAGVPQNDFANILSNLNQANVPPTEFVQVVRYVPVALVQQPAPFVQYVDNQVAQGVTGPQLVTVIDNNLATNYGVTPVVVPDQVVYVDQSYIPQTVLSRLTGSDPLALALMPLAVAEVSQAAGVPQDQLANLLATLNQANVPPAQFVQVVQYAPVALTAQNVPQPFVPFVQTQVAQGITGPALVATIDQRLPQYVPQYVPQYTNTYTPQYAAPPVALAPQRIEAARPPREMAFEHNPHGGPPGQIKKMEGLQTGAEVVHGERPNFREHRGNPHGMPPGLAKRVEVPPPMASSAPPVMVPVPQVRPQPGPPGGIPPGQAKRQGGDEGPGHGEGHGNGHGHGKD